MLLARFLHYHEQIRFGDPVSHGTPAGRTGDRSRFETWHGSLGDAMLAGQGRMYYDETPMNLVTARLQIRTLTVRPTGKSMQVYLGENG